jgi:hypothetical protein
MRSVLNSAGRNRVERLVAELRAIERWNTHYWQNSDPEAYEKLAFLTRRERRAELLSELLTLIPRLATCAKGNHIRPGAEPEDRRSFIAQRELKRNSRKTKPSRFAETSLFHCVDLKTTDVTRPKIK